MTMEYVLIWTAVVIQAAVDAVKPVSDNKTKIREYDKALAWFNSDRVDIGSFKWICNVLDLPYRKIISMVTAGKFSKEVFNE